MTKKIKKVQTQTKDTYRIGQRDLSGMSDWELHGFQNANEYGQYLDFNSKGDDSYENFKENNL